MKNKLWILGALAFLFTMAEAVDLPQAIEGSQRAQIIAAIDGATGTVLTSAYSYTDGATNQGWVTAGITNGFIPYSITNAATADQVARYSNGVGIVFATPAAGGSSEVFTNAPNTFSALASNKFEGPFMISNGTSAVFITTTPGFENLVMNGVNGSTMGAVSNSTVIGQGAGEKLVSVGGNYGYGGVLIGKNAGGSLQYINDNVFIGFGAGSNVVGSAGSTGFGNVVLGNRGGLGLDSGEYRATVIGGGGAGSEAGNDSVSIGNATSASDLSIAIGNSTLLRGTETIAVGYYIAGGSASGTPYSTFLGSRAGIYTTAAYNIMCLGYNATIPEATVSNIFMYGKSTLPIRHIFGTNAPSGANGVPGMDNRGYFNQQGATTLGVSGTIFSNYPTILILTNFGVVNAGTVTTIGFPLAGVHDGDAVKLRLPWGISRVNGSNVVFQTYCSNGVVLVDAINNCTVNVDASSNMLYGATPTVY